MWVDLRREGPKLSGSDAALLALAQALVHWNQSNAYSAATGEPMTAIQGGHARSVQRCETLVDSRCLADYAIFPSTPPWVSVCAPWGAFVAISDLPAFRGLHQLSGPLNHGRLYLIVLSKDLGAQGGKWGAFPDSVPAHRPCCHHAGVLRRLCVAGAPVSVDAWALLLPGRSMGISNLALECAASVHGCCCYMHHVSFHKS
jgi:hypothetical protein